MSAASHLSKSLAPVTPVPVVAQRPAAGAESLESLEGLVARVVSASRARVLSKPRPTLRDVLAMGA